MESLANMEAFLNEPFAEIAAAVKLISKAYLDGEIAEDEAYGALVAAQFSDSAGATWSCGPSTGTWFRRGHDADGWVVATTPPEVSIQLLLAAERALENVLNALGVSRTPVGDSPSGSRHVEGSTGSDLLRSLLS